MYQSLIPLSSLLDPLATCRFPSRPAGQRGMRNAAARGITLLPLTGV